jgi:hypothetical protein
MNEKKSVFAIFSGEYSDWEVHGFFTNLEDAEKYCVVKNENISYGEFYVEEISNIIADVSDVKVIRVHEVVFDITRNGMVMRNEPDRYKIKSAKSTLPQISVDRGGIWIAVRGIVAETRESAEKIAQDKLAEFLAVKKGVV